MKNIAQLTTDFGNIANLLNGVQKLQDRWKLLHEVQQVNEILIKETDKKLEEAKEKYAKDNTLLESFIKLYASMTKNFESRHKRATKDRSNIFQIMELMEIKPEYDKFYYNRGDWDQKQELTLEEFSDKYAVIY